MQKRNAAVVGAILILAGCTTTTTDAAKTPTQAGSLPEAVVALAAPGQDLSTARLLPEDRCYWYQHRGPVETTLVPLRAVGGGPICMARRS